MKPTFDLTLTSGLDQPTNLSRSLDVASYAESVQELINIAANEKNLHRALEHVTNFNNSAQRAGVGLAVAFHQMLMRWEDLSGRKFRTMEERQTDFEETMFDHFGKVRDTVRRYLMAGSFLTGLEFRIGRLKEGDAETVLTGFPERPVIDLIAVAQYEREHGALTPKQLVSIATAEDRSTVRRMLREFRGDTTEESLLKITIDLEGNIVAHHNGAVAQVGFLRRDVDDTGIRGRAVNRIIKRAGLQEG